MAVSFNTIPAKIYTPLFYAEVDNSAANTTTDDMRSLIIAPMARGQAQSLELTRVTSVDEAAKLFGAGSIAHRMVSAYRDQDSTGTLFVLPIDDSTGGIVGTKTITVTGAATSAGVIYLYVGYDLVQVSVESSDNETVIASAISTAINARTDLPVTATSDEGVVTVTAKNRGAVGGDFPINVNLLGVANGQILPAGISIEVAVGTEATGSGTLESAFAALKEEAFEFIAMPYADKVAFDAAKAAMTKRWSYDVQLYGHVYSAARGDVTALTILSAAQNDPHLTLFGVSKTDPNYAYERLAAAVGKIAVSVKADPARPFQTLALTGITAPRIADRFDRAEREQLLAGGIATFVDTMSDTQIERAVTTYTKNAYGSTDNSYQDAETLHTLGYIIRYMRTRITSKFGRHKLASDGTKVAEGQAIVTPKIIRSELIAQYGDLETMGLVENAEEFQKALVVERNATDPNRIDVLLPPDLVNQLRVFAALVQFRLQY